MKNITVNKSLQLSGILSLLGLVFFSQNTIAANSFLDDLKGDYKIGGPKCNISYVELSSQARATVGSDSLVLNLNGTMHGMKQELSYTFYKGSGEAEEVVESGTVFPIKVKQRTVWNTDEQKKVSTTKYYEGAIFSKLVSSYSLKVVSDKKLVFSIDNENVLCELTPN